MKLKEELLGQYREIGTKNTLHKDEVFLEVLIDIRDALSAVAKQVGRLSDQPWGVRRKVQDRQTELRYR